MAIIIGYYYYSLDADYTPNTKIMMQTQWTPDQINILKLKYPTENLAQLAHELGKSLTATKSRANSLGLKRISQKPRKQRVLKEKYKRENTRKKLSEKEIKESKIEAIEKEMETIERSLFTENVDMKSWNNLMRRYNSAIIQYNNLTYK